MPEITLQALTEQLNICDQLLSGRSKMIQPQDLPGRYGRVVKAVDHRLQVTQCEALLAGGWAVWFHGFLGRVTQDIDIVLPAGRIDDFLQAAAVSGFELLPTVSGRWPKVRHKDTDIQVDILPEGGRPGTASRPAPTTIPSPVSMGVQPGPLHYVPLAFLVELKLAAGRARDEADVVELLRANPQQVEDLRRHLAAVHSDYVDTFERLLQLAREQRDE